MNLVVDCSFIMSSFLPDETKGIIEEIYQQIVNKVHDIYAPSVFYLECNNVLRSSLRKKRINHDDWLQYLQLLQALSIKIDNFCASTESLYTIARIAANYDLTSYDAAYLELAQRLEAKIATLDRNLAASCKDAGVEVVTEKMLF